MEAVQIKKAWVKVKFHTKIAWGGFYRALYGAAACWLIAIAICGFMSVDNESGWIAVCDFVASCATLIIALSNVYLMGCCKKGGKYSG